VAATIMSRRRRDLVCGIALALASPDARGDAELEGCPPWCPPAHVKEEVSARARGRWWPGFAMRSLSLRGSSERTQIGRDDRTGGSLGVEERALAYLSLGRLSARYADFLSLGGSDAGVDGGLGVDAALGYRAPIGERHGPFGRLGVRAHMHYRAHFYTSLLELPQAQLGYAYLGRRFHVEAAARGGPVLTGRYGVDGGAATRLDGSLEAGGYIAMGFRPLRLDVEASRVRLDSGGAQAPVDSVDVLLCGVLSKPIVCFHGSADRGKLAGISGLTPATGTYVGVSIGFGPVEWR
jgi:hypothetical protein